MKNEQILHAIGQIDHAMILAAKEDSAETKHKPIRPLRLVLIAAVVGLLLAGSGVALYQLHVWNTMLEAQYMPDETQKVVVDAAVSDVNVSVVQDGCTFTVRQVLGDDHFVAVALEIQLPEETAIPEFTTEELRALAERNGYPWTVPESDYETHSVTRRLGDLYGYDAAEETFVGGVRMDTIILAPISATKDELLAEIAKKQDEYGEDDLRWEDNFIHHYLGRKCIETLYGDAWDGSYDGFGNGTLQKSYAPETNTLSLLIYMDTGADTPISGRACTLVLDGLFVEDILGTYSKPATDTCIPEAEEEELTSGPVVLNFTADYQPTAQDYDILKDGIEVGTLTLSPLSIYLDFPLEAEDAAYSSLEEAALAAEENDVLLRLFDEENLPKVWMEDGSVVSFRPTSGGVTDHADLRAMATTLIDLEQIQCISWDGYEIVPQ